jgi:hypothetical protein
MKKVRTKVVEYLSGAWSEIEYGLKRLCGRPSPAKRFIAVLTVGSVLAVINIYFVTTSIYNMGKSDAKKEFLKVEYIRQPDGQPLNRDSMNNPLPKKYEYE